VDERADLGGDGMKVLAKLYAERHAKQEYARTRRANWGGERSQWRRRSALCREKGGSLVAPSIADCVTGTVRLRTYAVSQTNPDSAVGLCLHCD